jgi:hypothetical protein
MCGAAGLELNLCRDGHATCQCAAFYLRDTDPRALLGLRRNADLALVLFAFVVVSALSFLTVIVPVIVRLALRCCGFLRAMIVTLVVVIPMVMPVIVLLGGMLSFVSVFLIRSLALASQKENNCRKD